MLCGMTFRISQFVENVHISKAHHDFIQNIIKFCTGFSILHVARSIGNFMHALRCDNFELIYFFFHLEEGGSSDEVSFMCTQHDNI